MTAPKRRTPKKPGAQKRPARVPHGKGEAERERPLVLLVDDDTDYLSRVANELINAGLRVVTASSSAEAIRHLELAKPDVVLLDLMMPATSGLDLLKDIKGLAPKTPVVVVSALWDDEVGAKARKAGAADYLVKPVSSEVLQIEILSHLL